MPPQGQQSNTYLPVNPWRSKGMLGLLSGVLSLSGLAVDLSSATSPAWHPAPSNHHDCNAASATAIDFDEELLQDGAVVAGLPDTAIASDHALPHAVLQDARSTPRLVLSLLLINAPKQGPPPLV